MPIFDGEAKHYDDFFETPLGQYIDRAESEALFQMMGPIQGKRILDYGAGSGNLTQKLKKRGAQVTGVDISLPMQQKALAKGLDVRLYDGVTLPFSENYFDVAVSLAVFEFIDNPKSAIDEIMRVLKKGSLLYLGTIQKGGPYALRYAEEDFKDSVFRHAKFLGKEDLAHLGYEMIDHKTCLFVPPDGDIAKEHIYEKERRGSFLWIALQK